MANAIDLGSEHHPTSFTGSFGKGASECWCHGGFAVHACPYPELGDGWCERVIQLTMPPLRMLMINTTVVTIAGIIGKNWLAPSHAITP